MRPLYDDFDEFDFDDSVAVKQMLREMQREELRLASRRKRGPGNRQRWQDEDDDDAAEFEDYADYEDSENYEDYDDDEFDSYSAIDDYR
jgi:hypothetical protein